VIRDDDDDDDKDDNETAEHFLSRVHGGV